MITKTDLTPKARYPHNGAMTKHILAVARATDVTPEQLATFTARVLQKWGMSSMKVVYDQDIAALDPKKKEAILEVCVAHDKRGFEQGVQYFMDMLNKTRDAASLQVGENGMYGRYKIK